MTRFMRQCLAMRRQVFSGQPPPFTTIRGPRRFDEDPALRASTTRLTDLVILRQGMNQRQRVIKTNGMFTLGNLLRLPPEPCGRGCRMLP